MPQLTGGCCSLKSLAKRQVGKGGVWDHSWNFIVLAVKVNFSPSLDPYPVSSCGLELAEPRPKVKDMLEDGHRPAAPSLAAISCASVSQHTNTHCSLLLAQPLLIE